MIAWVSYSPLPVGYLAFMEYTYGCHQTKHRLIKGRREPAADTTKPSIISPPYAWVNWVSGVWVDHFL
jgi:hypothetical protein